MPDSNADAIAGLVGRVEGAACWLAGVAMRAAVAGGAAGLVLWWFTTGERVTSWWQGTAGSLVVLGLCLAPALWLLNVRRGLVELVELPETLRGVATRRAGSLRGVGRPPAPPGGLRGAVRAVRSFLGDYGDVAGSWGTVAQMMAPTFWLLTLVAIAAVPVVAVLAAVAAILGSSA